MDRFLHDANQTQHDKHPGGHPGWAIAGFAVLVVFIVAALSVHVGWN